MMEISAYDEEQPGSVRENSRAKWKGLLTRG